MKRILYISRSLVGGDAGEINRIATISMQRNSRCAVTGYLYFDSDIFIQALEGPRDDVDAIYDSILRDVRHKDIKTLADEPITQRHFGGWAMGVYNGGAGLLRTQFSPDIAENATEADAPELIRFLRDLSIGREDVYVLPKDNVVYLT